MTAASPAVVWGASGHACVVANAARLSSLWQIAGFVDEVNPSRRGESFMDSVVLGGSEALDELAAAGAVHVLLGVGDNRARLRIADEVERGGFQLGVVIHPAAVVAPDVTLGAGCFVSAGAIINPGASLGRAVIVNSNAVVEHHCELADGVHVAPGALLGGHVRVGRLSWVGIGAVVKEKTRIGEETILGAGSVALRDLENRVVAYGIPATKRRGLD